MSEQSETSQGLDYGKLDNMLTDLRAHGFESVHIYGSKYFLADVEAALDTFGELSIDDERLAELEDHRQQDALRAVELRHDLEPYLGLLDDRTRFVVALKFGLDGEPEHTEEEIAATLKLSRRRTRELVQHALDTLRDYMTMDGWNSTD